MSNALIKKTADFLQQPKQVDFLAGLLASTPEEAARVVKTAIVQIMANPTLAKCEPLSVFRAVAQAAQLGLELGQEAHVIPYGGQATMQADYKGLMRLAVGNGIAKVRGDVVYAADGFDYTREPLSLKHKPHLGDDRGDFRLAYAVAYDTEGRQIEATIILASELARLQSKSRSPAWKEWPDRMRIKSAIKRCCKHLPLNTRAARLIRIEDNADAGQFVDPEIDDLGKVIDAPRLEEGSHRIRDLGTEAGEQTETPAVEPDPEMDKPKPKPKRSSNGNGKRKCSVCGETGHNARSCPEKDGKQTEEERLEETRQAVREAQAETQSEPPPPGDSDRPGWGFGNG